MVQYITLGPGEKVIVSGPAPLKGSYSKDRATATITAAGKAATPTPGPRIPTPEPTPAPSVGGYTVTTNLLYRSADGRNLFLDAYAPSLSNGPAVVCAHGGGWRGGHRSELDSLCRALAAAGIAAFSIDYRVIPFPPTPCPPLAPGASGDFGWAIGWVTANAASFNVDPNRIGAFGGSAGGHLALMAGSATRAIVAWSPPTDLAALPEPNIGAARDYCCGRPNGQVSDCAERLDANSPARQVYSGYPPTLMVFGADEIMPVDQGVRMQDAIRLAGGVAELVALSGDSATRHSPDYANDLTSDGRTVTQRTVDWFLTFL